MNSVAVIPARGGSKRIPGKNLRNFLGKPILERVVQKLLTSEAIERVFVSTDSTEIAEAAISFGAEVPFLRPSELSDDFASTSAVMKHATSFLLSEISVSSVFCVYPTSVGLTHLDIDNAVKLFEEGQWDYVFSATEPASSAFRGFTRTNNGGAEMLFPQYWDSRSQDLPRAFADAALFYLATNETWQLEKPIFSRGSTFIEIPEFRAIDINTEEDWLRAERALQLTYQQLKTVPNSED